MNDPLPEDGLENMARLGEPTLVCRTSRRTLFWGFLLASLLSGFGLAFVALLLKNLLVDPSKDVLGCVVYLAIAALSLWGGIKLWRKANGKRQVRVAVHAGGLSYHDEETCLTCRWDQIAEVRWNAKKVYETTHLTVGGVLPVPGTTSTRHIHTTHQITVQLKDSVQLGRVDVRHCPYSDESEG
jgi:hypothetical protein